MLRVVAGEVELQPTVGRDAGAGSSEQFRRDGRRRMGGLRPCRKPFRLFPDPESHEIVVVLLETGKVVEPFKGTVSDILTGVSGMRASQKDCLPRAIGEIAGIF